MPAREAAVTDDQSLFTMRCLASLNHVPNGAIRTEISLGRAEPKDRLCLLLFYLVMS